MNKTTAITLAVLCGISAAALAQDAKGPATLPPDAAKTGVTYTADIKPIFDAACVKCHDSKGTRPPKAGLALNSLEGVLKGSRHGKVVMPGDSAKSSLVLAVAHIGKDPDSFMPKGRDAKKLSDAQIGLIRAWVDQGAK